MPSRHRLLSATLTVFSIVAFLLPAAAGAAQPGELPLVPSIPFGVPSEYLLRPHTIALGGSACSPYLSHLRWLSYGRTGARAVGKGVFPVLGPYPDNCSEALARTVAKTVHVVLSSPRRCEGALIFTRIGWRARGSHEHSVIHCD